MVKNIYVQPETRPIDERPIMYWGNKPTDGGWLILDTDEARELIAAAPDVSDFVRSYYGSTEFIKSKTTRVYLG